MTPIPQIAISRSPQDQKAFRASLDPMQLLDQLYSALKDNNPRAIQDYAETLTTRLLSNEKESNDYKLVKVIYDICNDLFVKYPQAADNIAFTTLLITVTRFLLQGALENSDQNLNQDALENSDQNLKNVYLQALLNFSSDPRHTRLIHDTLKALQANFSGGINDDAFTFLFLPIETLGEQLDREDSAPMPDKITAQNHQAQHLQSAVLIDEMCKSLHTSAKARDYGKAQQYLELLADTYCILVPVKAVQSAAFIFDHITTAYHAIYASNQPNAQLIASAFFTRLKQLYEKIPDTKDYTVFRQTIGKEFALIEKMHEASHLLRLPTLTEVQQWLEEASAYVTGEQYDQASIMYKKVNETLMRLPSNDPEAQDLADNIDEQMELHRAIYISLENEEAIAAMKGKEASQKETA